MNDGTVGRFLSTSRATHSPVHPRRREPIIRLNETHRAFALFACVLLAIILSLFIGTEVRHTEWFVYTYEVQGERHVHWFPLFFAVGAGGVLWAILFDGRPRTISVWLGYAVLARIAFILAVSLPGFILLAFAIVLVTPFLLAFQAIDAARPRYRASPR